MNRRTEQNRIAAFDWGRSIGEVRRLNNQPRGTPEGTGLRGSVRDAFLLGLIAGYEKPRAALPPFSNLTT